jgi:hypothetical protein
MDNLMTKLSNDLNCDKSTYHQYTEIYPIFLDKFKDENISLLEIGFNEGKSYKLWESYFNAAKIYAMDINHSGITERGEIFKGDQSNLNDLIKVSSNINNCKIIIDDGSHVAEHQLKSFHYLFENLLKNNGVYIIEDIECSYWSPDAMLYGYTTGYLNIVDYFSKLNHSVNNHYNLQPNPLNIKMITFAPNCIIIQKGNEIDKIRKEYQFSSRL